MKHFASACLVTALLLPARVDAQTKPLADVPFGARVRLATCTGATITGDFGGVRGDSIDVARDSVATTTVTFPPDRYRVTRSVATSCVTTYSVFERYGKRTGQGAMIGGGLGLALMTVTYIQDRAYERRGGAAQIPGVAIATPLALILTGVGAWIGHSSGPEEWSPPKAVAAAIRPTPRGLGVHLALRF